MKKILTLLFLIFIITSCGKKELNPPLPFNKSLPYIIVGKEDTGTSDESNRDVVLSFDSDGKARFYTVSGIYTDNYTLKENTIFLENHGSLKVSDNKISDYAITGWKIQIEKRFLLKIDENLTPLVGKYFNGTFHEENQNGPDHLVSGFFTAYLTETTIKTAHIPSGEKIPLNLQFTYNKIGSRGSTAGYIEYKTTNGVQNTIFYVDANGKLNYSKYEGGNTFRYFIPD